MTTLTNDQVATAERMWSEGKRLGEIAEVLGCSAYDLYAHETQDDER